MNLITRLSAFALAIPVFAGSPPTFTENIAPLVYKNCTTCHRPGEAAPFSLISYEDVKKHGALVQTVTKSRYMPPWHAEHGFGEFADERRLSDSQIAMIADWVKAGMPEGDVSKMPPLPPFPQGWHLGKPDLVMTMPKAFSVPASGPDLYRNFVIPTQLTEDKWVRAVEFKPTAGKTVHHCLFAYDAAGVAQKLDGEGGEPGFSGMAGVQSLKSGPLGGWAVGATAHFMPEGLALYLPKGADLILQMHFHMTGKAEQEQATVGIYFADRPPDHMVQGIQVPSVFGIGAGIDIPAGEKTFTIKDSFTLPVDTKVYAIRGHAHYICKEMKAVAMLPDGSTRPLLWIKDWDFAWQDAYVYRDPMVLPKGTKISAELTYDNSAENVRNPSSPPKRVWWGEQSTEEMGSVILQTVAVQKTDEAALRAALQEQSRTAINQAVKDGTVARMQEEQKVVHRSNQ